jgi:serine/threonine protein phosphatase PrpC
MGCCSSSASDRGPAPVGTQRRRLSVGEVDNTEKDADVETEADRGLMNQLDQQDIVQILNDSGNTGDRKMSIGSNTDGNKTSFANKSMQEIGDKLDPVKCAIGYTCRKGLKPESPNQDSWFVLRLEGEQNCSIYAVFDGHGKKGHDVSNFVKEHLPKLIVKDSRFMTDEMPAMLKDVFKKMQSLIMSADRMKILSAQLSGTTCTVAIHDHTNNKITMAHVADSTAAIGSTSGDKLHCTQLTRDHKPQLKDERERIERNGGRVVFDGYANYRVYAKGARYPGLNMSRCLGDLMGHQDCGISCEPEVVEYSISDTDTTLFVCSDGIWEFIDPPEAYKIVHEFKPEQAMQAAEKLAKEAWDRWIREEGGSVVDDITVVLVHLKKGNANNANNANT